MPRRTSAPAPRDCQLRADNARLLAVVASLLGQLAQLEEDGAADVVLVTSPRDAARPALTAAEWERIAPMLARQPGTLALAG